MLNTAKTLSGYTLRSLDGDIGKVEEFYFDDHNWTVRYLVANTGNWITGRLVLIPPYALTAVNKEEQCIAVNLTKKQIEDSPSWSHDKPVSLQFEELYSRYYGIPSIVQDSEMWRETIESIHGETSGDPHLRSSSTVSGYDIHASDGEIGHVEDFVIDDETWAIRYLVIDTQNWLPGKKVLISPQWIERVSWELSTVFVKFSRDAIKQAPEYNAEALVSQDYENEMYKHYNSQGYWVDEKVTKDHSS